MADRSMIDFNRPDDTTLRMYLSGNWTIEGDIPSADVVEEQIKVPPPVKRIAVDTTGLADWDSGLVNFLLKVIDLSSRNGIDLERDGLPRGVNRLLKLALAVPEKEDAHRKAERKPFLQRVGDASIEYSRSSSEVVDFIGQVFLGFARLLRGRAHFRRSDLTLFIQEAGAQALPIVTLISLLVGLILAFVGAIQLKMFGAQLYVADLVGIAMTREMGAMMTAIIMAGRTGAAFAAQLGTMQVNDEIDAFKTLGISPMEFLVVPRMLALVLMMPLLCLYADFMGIMGGVLVGVGMLNLSFAEYWNETRLVVTLTDCYVGIVKSIVFGALVALAGCLRGMQCGRSASAVGAATTSAVVLAIVLIIISDALFAVITNELGI